MSGSDLLPSEPLIGSFPQVNHGIMSEERDRVNPLVEDGRSSDLEIGNSA